MIGVRYISAGIAACTISRTSPKKIEIAVRASDVPKVKRPTIRRLTGRNQSVAYMGAPTASMIASSTTSERPRFTSPEMMIERVKIDGGTRTRFMSGPFHAELAMAFTTVWEKKFQPMYAERKYVS